MEGQIAPRRVVEDESEKKAGAGDVTRRSYSPSQKRLRRKQGLRKEQGGGGLPTASVVVQVLRSLLLQEVAQAQGQAHLLPQRVRRKVDVVPRGDALLVELVHVRLGVDNLASSREIPPACHGRLDLVARRHGAVGSRHAQVSHRLRPPLRKRRDMRRGGPQRGRTHMVRAARHRAVVPAHRPVAHVLQEEERLRQRRLHNALLQRPVGVQHKRHALVRVHEVHTLGFIFVF
mmetsp:Transcript_45816/g.115364  ORF Transcript_45816/g.115364 Transcript_45816/m.115364 type:complete len:232 (+) Transcript_45816:67-762(+)